MPSAKRNIQRKSRKFKLIVLCYWKYNALVPDEDLEGACCHVTWQEVAARYQAVFNGGTGHIISKSFRQLGLALFIDGSCDKELNV